MYCMALLSMKIAHFPVDSWPYSSVVPLIYRCYLIICVSVGGGGGGGGEY